MPAPSTGLPDRSGRRRPGRPARLPTAWPCLRPRRGHSIRGADEKRRRPQRIRHRRLASWSGRVPRRPRSTSCPGIGRHHGQDRQGARPATSALDELAARASTRFSSAFGLAARQRARRQTARAWRASRTRWTISPGCARPWTKPLPAGPAGVVGDRRRHDRASTSRPRPKRLGAGGRHHGLIAAARRRWAPAQRAGARPDRRRARSSTGRGRR